MKKAYIAPRLLTNLIPDGDFETTGWSGGSRVSAKKKYGQYSRKLTGNTGSFEVTVTSSASMKLQPTHVYYACIEAYQDAKSGSVDIYWPIAEPSMLAGYSGPAGQWNKVSVVTKRSTFGAGNYQIRFDFNNANGTGAMWFDGAMLIDLTAEFGAGKEPDKAWCDAYIAFTAGGQVCATNPTSSVKVNAIKNIYVGASNTAKKVKRTYIGVNGTAERVFSEYPSLNSLSWSEIRNISDQGLAEKYFSVGDAKKIVLNGTTNNVTFSNYEIWAVIIGINHNKELEGDNRIHFQIGQTGENFTGSKQIALADSQYDEYIANGTGYFSMTTSGSNSGGWANSNMRLNVLGTSINQYGTLIRCLPSDLRSVLKTVVKYSNNVGNSPEESAVTATTDYMFLLSAWEFKANTNYVNLYEQQKQKQYEFYKLKAGARYPHFNPTVINGAQTNLTRTPSVPTETWRALSLSYTLGVSSNEISGIAPCFCV